MVLRNCCAKHTNAVSQVQYDRQNSRCRNHIWEHVCGFWAGICARPGRFYLWVKSKICAADSISLKLWRYRLKWMILSWYTFCNDHQYCRDFPDLDRIVYDGTIDNNHLMKVFNLDKKKFLDEKETQVRVFLISKKGWRRKDKTETKSRRQS